MAANLQALGRGKQNIISLMRVWSITIIVILLLNGCTPWRAQYLKEVTGRATQDDIALKFGLPTEEDSLGATRTVWVYRYNKGESWCREYILEFDKKKILRDWGLQKC